MFAIAFRMGPGLLSGKRQRGRPKHRSGMTVRNALASLAVRDISKSIEWYEQLFGRPADARPLREVAEWRFESGGGLQVYAGVERAGGCSCTLVVSNHAEQRQALTKLGVAMDERASTERTPTIMIRDLDGNSIAFVQPA